jgi:hypothetical protein
MLHAEDDLSDSAQGEFANRLVKEKAEGEEDNRGQNFCAAPNELDNPSKISHKNPFILFSVF